MKLASKWLLTVLGRMRRAIFVKITDRLPLPNGKTNSATDEQ
jgi:hypothetical protein